MDGLEFLTAFFMETVGGLLGGAFFLPAAAALVVGAGVLVVMIVGELRK